ncbi:DNA photolyase family protein [Acetobacter indonesiensis]|uniref:cryptochrome/photolyase family protein n=1 Tax=Acetobacter indonesiensis TaxID=104101 RepID=UPI001F3C7BA3|nr:deoxyribodipyrimidine photo-lyase [Acetobacter indonesiensis]MCG0994673.1 DNA photolyase family protein [Acetobacter indonesiensis]
MTAQKQPTSPAPVLVLFRDDFRLTDNPALHAACASGQPVVCAYVHDPATYKQGVIGWWLAQARAALHDALTEKGGHLLQIGGDTVDIVPALVKHLGINSVFWNRRYDPVGKAQDTTLKTTLESLHVDVQSLAVRLLHEPWTIRTGASQPYRVFTAWWRAAQNMGEPGRCLPAPQTIEFHNYSDNLEKTLKAQAILPARLPDGATAAEQDWPCSEEDALEFLHDFVENNLAHYADERNRPDKDTTSRLSPYLRAGLLSARQVWHAVRAAPQKAVSAENAQTFLAELGWRDFAWMQLFYEPDLATRNLRPEFDHLPWHHAPDLLEAWKMGQTGYPLVDAGMRQLYTTGWMHNRVRMVVASFLTKHLLTDWREGERWFHDRLVDADPAQNAMNWQWCAGTGIDASPWFRIFNPVGQSEKFDPSGAYIRTWVPELRLLPDKLIHTPWKADAALCRQIGFTPGKSYPAPLVDLKQARAIALESWKNLPDRKQAD